MDLGLDFYPDQARAVAASAPRCLFLKTSEHVGASYALRARLALAALSGRDSRALVYALSSNRIRAAVLAGDGSIPEAFAPAFALGLAQTYADGLRIAGSRVLVRGGVDTPSIIAEGWRDLYIDDADKVPAAVLSDLIESCPGRCTIVCDAGGPVAKRYGSHFGAVELTEAAFWEPKERISGYLEWLRRVHGSAFVEYDHVLFLVHHIDLWIQGVYENLCVHMPAQNGKTFAGPENAPARILELHPTWWVGAITYNAKKAARIGRKARENYLRAGGEIGDPDTMAEWSTQQGGGLWCSTYYGGGGTGYPATKACMDDVDKTLADAIDPRKKAMKRVHFDGTLQQRASMFAEGAASLSKLITQTKQDGEDISSYALKKGEARGEEWAVIALPGIYDPTVLEEWRAEFPTFDVIDDYREREGEPLIPERRSEKQWLAIIEADGEAARACDVFQRVKGMEFGGFYKRDWFNREDADPAFAGTEQDEGVWLMACRAWDLAATEGRGDWTAGVKGGFLRGIGRGQFWVRNVCAERFASRKVKMLIACGMLLDGPDVPIYIPKEAAVGKAFVEGVIEFVRAGAVWAGVRLPRIYSDSPSRAAGAGRTAKQNRNRDLLSLAQPTTDTAGKVQLPGGVHYVAQDWRPDLAGIIEDWPERCRSFPELVEIAKLARCFTGEWWSGRRAQGAAEGWLNHMHRYTGLEGGVDDQNDATVDCLRICKTQRKGRTIGARAA